MGNMRQCGMAAISYAGDSNDYTITPENWAVGVSYQCLDRTWADMLIFNSYLPCSGSVPISYSDSYISSGISVSERTREQLHFLWCEASSIFY